MNFGEALEAVKNGALIARKGWNGKGMFIFMRPECTASAEQVLNFVSVPDSAKAWIRENVSMSDNITFTAYLCMKAADGTIVNGWLASQTDMLSDDWEIVGKPCGEEDCGCTY